MRTATAYASGWIHAVVLAAAFGCGGGGGDNYDDDTGMVVELEPIPDQLIPLPDGVDTGAAFMVLIRGNVRTGS